MSEDVKLLPLPIWVQSRMLADAMQAYARANMEPLIDENEALRTDRDSFKQQAEHNLSLVERLRGEVAMLTHAVEQGHATIKVGHQLHDALANEMREVGVMVESDPIRVVNLRAERLEVALRGAADFLVKKGFASEAEYFLAHAALDQEGGNG